MSVISNLKISIVFHSIAPISHFTSIAEIRRVDFTGNRNLVLIKDSFSVIVF